MEASNVNSAPQRDMPNVPFLWTRGVAARYTLNYLDRRGVDAEPLLLRVEISRRKDETVVTFQPVVALDVPRGQFSELAALSFNRLLHGLTNRDFVPIR